MGSKILGHKRFSHEDQIGFARLSGDWNPAHMDPTLARRTQAGATVVHGIHTILVGMELAAAASPQMPGIASLKAIFNKVVYVEDLVEYQLNRVSKTGATVQAFVEGISVARLVITYGQPAVLPHEVEHAGQPSAAPEAAIELTFEEMSEQTGSFCVPATFDQIRAQFPGASRLWSAERVAAMVSTTLLVGMICPGLHSLYGGFTLHTADLQSGSMAYRVVRTDMRFRLVHMQVRGYGVFGTIDCFARWPPIPQPDLSALAQHSIKHAFLGSKVLIIGGSRGLGELTAKLLALGGAEVIITFARGQTDADDVAELIRGIGGICTVRHYDFNIPISEQDHIFDEGITHLYYFATPQIFRRNTRLFDSGRYRDFQQCYVASFYELFMRLFEATGSLSAFYPSSAAVTDRPRNMTEYTMAKAAGEILCADINAFLPNARIVASRLPRMLTDQTATLSPVDSVDPVSVILPIIRQVQA